MFRLGKTRDDEKEQPTKPAPNTGNAKITETDKQTMLEGYTVVPPGEWESLRYRTHVRYVKTDGTFVRGGFFKNKRGSKPGDRYIQLENGFNPRAGGYKTWGVDIKTIKTLYKKEQKGNDIIIQKQPPATVSDLQKIQEAHALQLIKVRTAINQMVAAINKLTTRVNALEQQQK